MANANSTGRKARRPAAKVVPITAPPIEDQSEIDDALPTTAVPINLVGPELPRINLVYDALGQVLSICGDVLDRLEGSAVDDEINCIRAMTSRSRALALAASVLLSEEADAYKQLKAAAREVQHG